MGDNEYNQSILEKNESKHDNTSCNVMVVGEGYLDWKELKWNEFITTWRFSCGTWQDMMNPVGAALKRVNFNVTIQYVIWCESTDEIGMERNWKWLNLSQWHVTPWKVTIYGELDCYRLKRNGLQHDNTLCNMMGVNEWNWDEKGLKVIERDWNQLRVTKCNLMDIKETQWNLMEHTGN